MAGEGESILAAGAVSLPTAHRTTLNQGVTPDVKTTRSAAPQAL